MSFVQSLDQLKGPNDQYHFLQPHYLLALVHPHVDLHQQNHQVAQ